MNVVYNLSRGMKTVQLLSELHGRTQGENQRERALLFAEWEKTPEVKVKGFWDSKECVNVEKKLPKAQVVLEYPGNYALLQEYHIADADIVKGTTQSVGLPVYPNRDTKTTLVKKGEIFTKFYLAGVNDEGLYFVRPLQGVPVQVLRSIDNLLIWLNKTDIGYTERVQGDICMRIMPYNTHLAESKQNKQYKKNAFGKITHVSYRLPKNGNNKGFTDFYHLESPRLINNLNFGDHRIKINGPGHMAIPHKTSMFAIEPLIVDAREFTMTHPEHGSRTIQVPEGGYAVLASQRGRDEITSHGVFD